MATLKVKDVLNGLMRKGFSLSQSDHAYLIFYCNGKKTQIRTKVSHGSSEIDDGLINLMSIQVKLDKRKFIELVNCPLTIDEYLRELKAQGISLR